jgi:hypothetical protein
MFGTSTVWAREDLPSEITAKRRAAWAGVFRTDSSADTSAPASCTRGFAPRNRSSLDVDGEPRRVRKGDLLEPNDPIALIALASFERVQVPM